jgi:membrane protein YdbS with pleckstrin-like domain
MTQEIFQNNNINISDLPVAETATYNKLDKAYLTVLLLARIIAFLILVVIFFFISQWSEFPELPFSNWLIYLGIAMLSILSIILGFLGFQRKAYALREKDIMFRSGLIIRNHVAIPFNRIQHCEVQQGAIERGFKLAKLKIYTAGGSSSDLSIPGLPVETAHKLRDFVLGKIISQHEEEE